MPTRDTTRYHEIPLGLSPLGLGKHFCSSFCFFRNFSCLSPGGTSYVETIVVVLFLLLSVICFRITVVALLLKLAVNVWEFGFFFVLWIFLLDFVQDGASTTKLRRRHTKT